MRREKDGKATLWNSNDVTLQVIEVVVNIVSIFESQTFEDY